MLVAKLVISFMQTSLKSVFFLFFSFIFLLFPFSLSAEEVLQSEQNSIPEIYKSAPISALNNAPVFTLDELEALRTAGREPKEGPLYDKMMRLLTSYDLEQPTENYELTGSLRVASFNINRGYALERLKLVLNPDPVLTELNQFFPDIDQISTLERARDFIRKKSIKEGINPTGRIAKLYEYLNKLIDSEDSSFQEIYELRKIKRKGLLSKGREKYYPAVYELAHEIIHLANADIIALQEVDWGMPRTNYAHVTRELAEAAGYGYVFAPEFLELLDDGTLYTRVKNLDENKLKALHGNAILSKWPIQNVRIVRYGESLTEDPALHEMKRRRCYNWYKEELPKIGPFEKLIYKFGEVVFKEKAIVPSVRLGSRMAVVAYIETPKGLVTVASTHLENRGNPKCRRAELHDLLTALKAIQDRPVIVAGDLNTTNEEARRPYFVHVLYWYIKNQLELSTLAAQIGTNVGLFFIGLPFPVPNPIPGTVQLINQAREWRNPAGIGSAERKLFRKELQQFQFDDGHVFDLRGTPSLNQRGSTRLLANSNQSTPIGYKPTYCFERNFGHLFCMKLDWIFVKNNVRPSDLHRKCKTCPDNTWAPTNPRTLYQSMLLGGLSDHAAITTDLIVPQEPELQPDNNR